MSRTPQRRRLPIRKFCVGVLPDWLRQRDTNTFAHWPISQAFAEQLAHAAKGAPWYLQFGGSRRDQESHVLARLALQRLLVRDQRVRDLFEWNGMIRTAEALAMRGQRAASRVGLQDRGELLLGLQRKKWLRHAEVRSVLYAMNDDCLQQIGAFVEPATRLVYETWKLPWPWLVVDLSKMFLGTVVAILFNRIAPHYEIEPVVPHVIDRKRLTYLDHVGADFHCQLQASSELRRRGVRPVPATISRDVDWFYRATVKNPRDSIGGIAREYHAAAHHADTVNTDHRATVKAAIARVKHVLGDVPLFVVPRRNPRG